MGVPFRSDGYSLAIQIMADAKSAGAAAPAKNDSTMAKRDYHRVVEALLSYEHVFSSPPTSPHKLHIPAQQAPAEGFPTIAALSLHPVLESILHILNCDLPSAHFLCRHAEISPKYESMYVHGILHRVEGDIDNTRAWYGNVKETEMFQAIWSDERSEDHNIPEIAKQGWERFLDRLERYRDRTRSRSGKGGWEQDEDKLDPSEVKDWGEEEQLLRETSLWEMKQALRYLEQRFGLDQVNDASQEFLGKMESGKEEYAKVAQNMVTGGEGWRTF